jgi:predicted DNA-binding transcriptional regulator
LSDKGIGWLLLLGSVIGIGVYFYLLFLSPWCWLTIQVSAFGAVGVVLLIVAWIGYTLATTPPPLPFEDLDLSDSDTE